MILVRLILLFVKSLDFFAFQISAVLGLLFLSSHGFMSWREMIEVVLLKIDTQLNLMVLVFVLSNIEWL